jgi:predicted acylesterase/phospholipase RssA
VLTTLSFVCSARAHTTHCECLRSYVTNTIGQQNHDCTVVEAARATTAAPVFFEPVTFKASGATFVDGAIRANNPIDYLMNEVEGLWPGRPLGCIISIGTGVTRINPLRTASPRLHEILVTLSQITADAANKARDFLRTRQGRELQEAGKYFRFSVEQGMDDVNLADPTTMPWMESMAVPYLEEKRREIELCARNMVNPTAVMTGM